MTKYIYIQCSGKKNFTFQVFDDIESARSAMRASFLKIMDGTNVKFLQKYESVDLTNKYTYYEYSGYGINKNFAWVSDLHNFNDDWEAKIIEFDLRTIF